MPIESFLASLGLEQFVELFRAQAIDDGLLAGLTDADLKEIGIAQLGHRKRILEAVARLGREGIAEADGQRAERRQLTVMFVDLVGSTEIAAQLDPEDMRDLIHGFHVTIAKEVGRFDGHIAQFLGDGVLVYFGWPAVVEDAAERAVRASLPIAPALGKLKSAASIPLQARIGIATGLVVVGGHDRSASGQSLQAAIGDAPNLAARLQSIAKPGGVVISEATRLLLGDMFILNELPRQQLKGLAAPVSMFEVVGERPLESRFGAKHAGPVAELVGREPELAILLAKWNAACRATAQTALLRGEPGIGKSRIVEALVETTASEPRHVLRYQCSPYHGDYALFPAVAQITQAAGLLDSDGSSQKLAKLKSALDAAMATSAEALPYVAALLGIAAAETPERGQETPPQRRNRTLQALIDMLAGLCARRPVLWIVEDLHWGDPTTIELVNLAAVRLDRARLFILATARPHFSAPLGGEPGMTAIELGRLDGRATRQIVARLSQGRNLPDALVDEIYQKTDGIPLFVEEITKTIVESGTWHGDGDSARFDSSAGQLSIPATLQDTLMARLGRSPALKEIAQTAAVIGRQFDYRTLSVLFSGPGNRVRELLDGLERSELIFRQGTPPDASYAFKHALVRDAAYGTLLKEDRVDLHQRLLLLEQRGGISPSVKAQHAEAAGLPLKALDYWELAASKALDRPAYREAVASLKNCIRLCASMADAEAAQRREYRYHLQTAQALLASQGYSAASTCAAFDAALGFADRLGDASLQLPALFGIWAGEHIAGRPAADIADRIMAIAQAEDLEGPKLVGLRIVGLERFYEGRFAECLKLVKASYDGYDPARHRHLVQSFSQDPRAAAGNYLVWSLWFLGHASQAEAIIEENIRWARGLNHPHTTSLTLCYTGAAANIFLRRPERVRAAAAEGLALAEGASHALWQAWSLIHLGWAMSQEEPAKGLAKMEAGLEEARRAGARRLEPFHLSLVAEAHARAGNHAAAAQHIARAFDAMEATQDRAFASELHRIRGLTVQLADGTGQSPEADFRQALEIAGRQGAPALQLRAASDLARLLAKDRRSGEAHALLSPIVSRFPADAETADLREARLLLRSPA
ncbi:MAG: AAA family ATPase [Rhizobiales bacterium]|nr:AAA family ATPase [Hyphomicrobiales bacterium]